MIVNSCFSGGLLNAGLDIGFCPTVSDSGQYENNSITNKNLYYMLADVATSTSVGYISTYPTMQKLFIHLLTNAFNSETTNYKAFSTLRKLCDDIYFEFFANLKTCCNACYEEIITNYSLFKPKYRDSFMQSYNIIMNDISKKGIDVLYFEKNISDPVEPNNRITIKQYSDTYPDGTLYDFIFTFVDGNTEDIQVKSSYGRGFNTFKLNLEIKHLISFEHWDKIHNIIIRDIRNNVDINTSFNNAKHEMSILVSYYLDQMTNKKLLDINVLTDSINCESYYNITKTLYIFYYNTYKAVISNIATTFNWQINNVCGLLVNMDIAYGLISRMATDYPQIGVLRYTTEIGNKKLFNL